MPKIIQDKRMVILLACLALSSLILLAGSLKRLEFRPAAYMGGSREVDLGPVITLRSIITNMVEVPLWKQVVTWLVVFVLILLISFLLTPQLRKQLIRDFLRMSLIVLGFFYLARNNPEIFTGFLNQFSPTDRLDSDQLAPTMPPPVFESPRVPDWLTYTVALGLTLLLVWVLVRSSQAWLRAGDFSRKRKPLSEIGKVARDTLIELKNGPDVENKILECYIRMCRAVEDNKGLHREYTMTPSEFSVRLADAGLPAGPVDRLTRLFETVRYGGRGGGQVEVNEAIASLTSILRYCGELV